MSCREGEKWSTVGDAGVSKADSGTGMGTGMGELRQTASSVVARNLGRVFFPYSSFSSSAGSLARSGWNPNRLQSSEVQQGPRILCAPPRFSACRTAHRAFVARGAVFRRVGSTIRPAGLGAYTSAKYKKKKVNVKWTSRDRGRGHGVFVSPAGAGAGPPLTRCRHSGRAVRYAPGYAASCPGRVRASEPDSNFRGSSSDPVTWCMWRKPHCLNPDGDRRASPTRLRIPAF